MNTLPVETAPVEGSVITCPAAEGIASIRLPAWFASNVLVEVTTVVPEYFPKAGA